MAAAQIPAGVWRVDTTESEITFRTSMLAVIPVRGRFEQFAGELRVDDTGKARGELTIEAASIRTGNAKRDAHLRTQDFFGADEYPQLTFVSDEVEGAQPRITGTLTIRDKTLPIDVEATVEAVAGGLKLEADFDVDHAGAGLGWAKPGMIRKTVAAHVALSFVPAKTAGEPDPAAG